MFDPQKQRETTRSIFMSSVHGLANVGAVAVTFFSVPALYSRTVDWVSSFAANHYGAELSDLASFAWFIILALLIFFIARASLSTLLVMGGLAIAVRFL
ncbi:MAG: hypothetical protein ACRBBN_12650 [Methyloligellaceae bacterium]